MYIESEHLSIGAPALFQTDARACATSRDYCPLIASSLSHSTLYLLILFASALTSGKHTRLRIK